MVLPKTYHLIFDIIDNLIVFLCLHKIVIKHDKVVKPFYVNQMDSMHLIIYDDYVDLFLINGISNNLKDILV